MRWKPATSFCAECSFDWQCDRDHAVAVVSRGPAEVADAMNAVPDLMARSPEIWSATMYVWHLVDVLRIGTERLLTLVLDPSFGIACWDENALAVARRYAVLSPTVGLTVLRRQAKEWEDVAASVPDDVEVEHPQFGVMGATEIIRRNAHEVQHHIGDIRRWATLDSGGDDGSPRLPRA